MCFINKSRGGWVKVRIHLGGGGNLFLKYGGVG